MSEPAPILFNPEELDDFVWKIPTTAIGRNFDYRDRTSSTNDLALEAGKNGGAHGKVFLAEVQHAGRGRRGRSWESPPGLSLLFSILIRPRNLDPMLLGWIPLAAGLGAANGLKRCAPVKLCLKWPNDLVIPSAAEPGWRKLGGILCESVLGTGDETFVVVGIGLNINQRASHLPEIPKSPPTSLLLETGQNSDRRAVLSAVLEEIEKAFVFLEESSALPALRSAIEITLNQTWRGRTISLRSPATDNGPLFSGPFAGLDDFGRIRIRERSGERTFADAEIIGLA